MVEQKPPREMSSRLLTMKFIQRAAASKSASPSPTTPTSAKKHRTDSAEDDDRSAKRVRTIDRAAVDAAVKEQEERRLAALEKHSAELGDTHWVLNSAVALAMKKRAEGEKKKKAAGQLRMAFVSQADLDRLDRPKNDEDEDEEKHTKKRKSVEVKGVKHVEEGRIMTANFKPKTEKEPEEDEESSPKEQGQSIFGSKSSGGGISQNANRNNNNWGNDKRRKSGVPKSISSGGR